MLAGITGLAGAPAQAEGSTASSAAARHSPKASALLRSLAAAADSRPGLRPTARYEYLRIRGWYWDENVDAHGRTHGELDRSVDELWVAGNGSGRVRRVDNGRTTIDHRFTAGQLTAPRKLPTDPRALQKLLAKSHPPYGTYEWFVAVNDVWNTQIVDPAVESALLRMLVGKPGMIDRGTITDKLGRRGVAISTDSRHSGHIRSTLIFDPATGALLDFDQHTLTRGGRPSMSPSAVDYSAWIAEGYVKTVTDRP